MTRPPHTDFVAAFRRGAAFRDRDGKYLCRTRRIGKVAVPSGRIAAGDPVVLSAPRMRLTFDRPVRPGRYPVDVCLARYHRDGADEPMGPRVACARVRLRPGVPVRWEMALPAGHTEAEIPRGRIIGYGVDTGTGCFVDGGAVEAADRAAFREFGDRIDKAVARWYRANPDRRWLTLWFPGGVNVVGFNTGLGDGAYASYWGLAADGRPGWLVTDFILLVENAEREFALGPVADVFGKRLRRPELAEHRVKTVILRAAAGKALPRRKGQRFVAVVSDGSGTTPEVRSGGRAVTEPGNLTATDRRYEQELVLTEALPDDAEFVVRVSDGVRALPVVKRGN